MHYFICIICEHIHRSQKYVSTVVGVVFNIIYRLLYSDRKRVTQFKL